MRAGTQTFYIFTIHHERETIMTRRKKYTLLGFLGDLLMTVITGGLWLIWIFVREMRNR